MIWKHKQPRGENMEIENFRPVFGASLCYKQPSKCLVLVKLTDWLIDWLINIGSFWWANNWQTKVVCAWWQSKNNSSGHPIHFQYTPLIISRISQKHNFLRAIRPTPPDYSQHFYLYQVKLLPTLVHLCFGVDVNNALFASQPYANVM